MAKQHFSLRVRFNVWYHNLWFMKLSREIAKSWYQAGKHGIDFGDMPFSDFVKYYCRDNTKHQWYRFFVSYKEIDECLERLYEIARYE